METKTYPYLENNLLQIGNHLKHINWNMGRIVSFLEGNPTLLKDIKKQIAETKEEDEEDLHTNVKTANQKTIKNFYKDTENF